MAQVGVKATLSLPVHDHATDPAGGKLGVSALDTEVYESMIYLYASDNLFTSNDAEKINHNISPQLFKEIKIYINPSFPYYKWHDSIPSTIRVKFDLGCDNVSYLGFAQVYLNGVAKGTLQSYAGGYCTFSQDINFGLLKDNDLIQLYAYSENALANVKIRNFRLYFNYSLVYFRNIFEYRPVITYGGGSFIALSENTLT